MNISHPMGQPEPAAAFQGPFFGEIPLWINGRTKAAINFAHALGVRMAGASLHVV